MITLLNDLPESLLKEARSLTDQCAVEKLLIQYTSPECWDYLIPFIEDVVFGNEPAANWMQGQVVVPDFSLVDHLCLGRSELLKPLGGSVEARIVPCYELWYCHAHWIGAPVLILPDANYHYRAPAQALTLGTANTESIINTVVTLRRWMAVRLAQLTQPWPNIESMEQLISTQDCLPSIDNWSEDARYAALGLICEYKELGAEGRGIPGMRGCDDWYEC